MSGDTLLMPIYLPEDFVAPFVDPLSATGDAVLALFDDAFFANQALQGKTLVVFGEMISPKRMVDEFVQITGIKARYENVFDPDGFRQHFPELAQDTLLMQEILGMVNYVVEFGYFSAERDLTLADTLGLSSPTWAQFLQNTHWQGQAISFD